MGTLSIRVICILMLGIGLAFSWLGLSEFVAVDRCLDAGGRFDYLRHSCEMSDSRPYAPGLIDDPLPVIVGLVLIGVSVVGLLIVHRKDAK
jgi:hypothetical protein